MYLRSPIDRARYTFCRLPNGPELGWFWALHAPRQPEREPVNRVPINS